MKVLRKIDDGWHVFEKWFALVMLSAVVLIVFLQVVNNSILHISSLTWTEEITKICLVWFIMSTSAIAVKTGSQLYIDVLVNKIKGPAKNIIDFAIMLFCIYTFFALTKSSWYLFLDTVKKELVYGITGCPKWVGSAALPFWFAVDTIRSAIILLYRIEDHVKTAKEKKGAVAV